MKVSAENNGQFFEPALSTAEFIELGITSLPLCVVSASFDFISEILQKVSIKNHIIQKVKFLIPDHLDSFAHNSCSCFIGPSVMTLLLCIFRIAEFIDIETFSSNSLSS